MGQACSRLPQDSSVLERKQNERRSHLYGGQLADSFSLGWVVSAGTLLIFELGWRALFIFACLAVLHSPTRALSLLVLFLLYSIIMPQSEWLNDEPFGGAFMEGKERLTMMLPLGCNIWQLHPRKFFRVAAVEKKQWQPLNCTEQFCHLV